MVEQVVVAMRMALLLARLARRSLGPVAVVAAEVTAAQARRPLGEPALSLVVAVVAAVLAAITLVRQV